MRSILKSLRGLGAFGTALANILAFLATNWVVTMTTIFSVWAGLSIWATEIIQRPDVQTTIEVFLATLWTLVGILYLFDRSRPRSVRSVPDYRYGLTFEGLTPNIDPSIDDNWLVFAFQIRNFSQAPIKYVVEKFDVRLGNRAMPDPPKALSGYLPRGGGKVISPSRFSKGDVQEFFGRRVKGTAKIAVIYGHPEERPIRRLNIEIGITIQLPTEDEGAQLQPQPPQQQIQQQRLIVWGADITTETDEALPDTP